MHIPLACCRNAKRSEKRATCNVQRAVHTEAAAGCDLLMVKINRSRGKLGSYRGGVLQPFEFGHQVVQAIDFFLVDFAAFQPFDVHRQLGHATAFKHRP